MFKLLLMLSVALGFIFQVIGEEPYSSEQIARGQEHHSAAHEGEHHSGAHHSGAHQGEHHGAEAGHFHGDRERENARHDLNRAGNFNNGGGAVVPVVEPIQTTPIVVPPSN